MSFSSAAKREYEEIISEFDFNKQYPILDHQGVLAICGTWDFVYELLVDSLEDHIVTRDQCTRMEQAIKQQDFCEVYCLGNSIKECAMCMHLPGLTAYSKAVEAAGRLLDRCQPHELPNYSTLINNLPRYLSCIQMEFQRLEHYLPIVGALRDQEAAMPPEPEPIEQGEQVADFEPPQWYWFIDYHHDVTVRSA